MPITVSRATDKRGIEPLRLVVCGFDQPSSEGR